MFFPKIYIPLFDQFDLGEILVRISQYGRIVIYYFALFFTNLQYKVKIQIPFLLDVEFSILEIMLGVGLSAFVTFTIYRWVKGLIPFA